MRGTSYLQKCTLGIHVFNAVVRWGKVETTGAVFLCARVCIRVRGFHLVSSFLNLFLWPGDDYSTFLL